MKCILCNETIDYGGEHINVAKGCVCWSCVNELVEIAIEKSESEDN